MGKLWKINSPVSVNILCYTSLAILFLCLAAIVNNGEASMPMYRTNQLQRAMMDFIRENSGNETNLNHHHHNSSSL